MLKVGDTARVINSDSSFDGAIITISRVHSYGEYEAVNGFLFHKDELVPVTSNDKIQASLSSKASKPRPTLLPTKAIRAGIAAMEFGTTKYEVDDWKTNPAVTERAIKDALVRHVLDYLDGEVVAPDSKVHHLGHIIANCAILLERFDSGDNK